MKKNQVIMILSIVVLFSIALVTFYFSFFTVKASKVYDMHVTVTEAIGFNLDADDSNIYFGKVSPGGSVTKTINITNTYKAPLKTLYKKSGEFAHLVSVPKQTIIQPGETYSAPITVNIPLNANYGNYTSKLRILLLKS